MATENINNAAKEQKEELEESYDKAIEEKEGKKVEVEIEGKVFELPPSPPEWFQLFISAYSDKQASESQYQKMIVKLLGYDIIDHLIESWDNDTPAGQLEKVVEKIMRAWIPEPTKKKK